MHRQQGFNPMTLTQAKALLRTINVAISKRDGEYRVNLAGGSEATAYYTNDLDDAVGTGKAMRAHGVGPTPTLKDLAEALDDAMYEVKAATTTAEFEARLAEYEIASAAFWAAYNGLQREQNP